MADVFEHIGNDDARLDRVVGTQVAEAADRFMIPLVQEVLQELALSPRPFRCQKLVAALAGVASITMLPLSTK